MNERDRMRNGVRERKRKILTDRQREIERQIGEKTANETERAKERKRLRKRTEDKDALQTDRRTDIQDHSNSSFVLNNNFNYVIEHLTLNKY